MVGVAQGHDLVAAGVAARGQDGGFVGFGPAVGEEAFGEAAAGRERGDLLGERGLRLIGEQGGDVLQGIELLVDLGIDLVVAVADAHGDDAAEEIQVLIAIGVPDVLVLGAGDYQGLFVEMKNGGEEVFLIRNDDFFFGHGVRPLPGIDTCRDGGRGRTARCLRTSRDHVEIEVGGQHLVLVARRLREDLAARDRRSSSSRRTCRCSTGASVPTRLMAPTK